MEDRPGLGGNAYEWPARTLSHGRAGTLGWFGGGVLEKNLRNAQRLRYRIAVLQPWFDLDEWKDVERLLAEARQGIALPPHLRAFLEDLG